MGAKEVIKGDVRVKKTQKPIRRTLLRVIQAAYTS